MDVLKGWSLEMGDDGKSRLAYTAEAAAAKARLDEYFRLLWEHREEFCDQVVEARRFVFTMKMVDLYELLRREGDPMLASVVLGSRLADRRIRVLGSLEEAVEEVARTMPMV